MALQQTVRLRMMFGIDIELLMAWRSNKLVYDGFYTQKQPLVWAEHIDTQIRRNPCSWRQWIIEYVTDDYTVRPVGWLGISCLDNWYPDIGILIGETTLWGKGIGKQALNLALDWLRDNKYQKARASVKEDNTRSQKLFESVGFHKVGEARIGELAYEVDLRAKAA